MSEFDIENWMHASDEERSSTHSSWDVNNGEGKEVAEGVAKLLMKECVYDVLNTEIVNTDGQWQIQAFADSDYDSLKDRDIEFLGFKLAIKKSPK